MNTPSHRGKKPNPNIERIRRLKRLEKFAERQLEQYIRIHKKNSKDIRYIG
ncbi:MAG: hypothetical protein HYT70_00040 [Candidatus Aenigmarchaeota archaeon]|nr:hypothetical protein [Candidatus Aenigmarchaeota archaeon]